MNAINVMRHVDCEAIISLDTLVPSSMNMDYRRNVGYARSGIV